MLWGLLLGGAGLVVILLLMLNFGGPKRPNGPTAEQNSISVLCAAGVRHPMEDIAQMYEEEYGVVVNLQFGGSNSLLSQIDLNKFSTADLFLAADSYYTDKAVEDGLAAETLPIAHMRPVIAVRKDNAKGIESFKDLLSDDVSVVAANPEAAAIGMVTKSCLEKITEDDSNLWAKLEEHVTAHGVFKPTVNDVAADVKLGSVDAGIVWDATVAMPDFSDELQAIAVPELEGEPNMVSIAVLNSTRQATEALKFARFVTARDRGMPLFEKYGLRPVEGDVWAERPEISFFCGSVNRRAVEKIIDDFQERENAVVNTIYDGCGILTSRMKTIEDQRQDLGFPDVYMACDVYYLENVKEWFQEAANVSDTEIVIAVPKGSEKVQSLDDLIKPGVRVAVGEPDQCTIGALTRRLLVKEGLYDQLKEKQGQEGEVVVEKSSSALLVPDVVTGHVDAAVAYITDTMANRDDVDIVRIDSPLNVAIQPFSIAKTSDHKYLIRRLFQRVAASPEAFEDVGFHFRLEQDEDAPASEADES